MKTLRAMRALLRVERRQLLRHPWRSLLVLMLVTVPVAAMVAGSAVGQMVETTPEERALQAMGIADLRVDAVDDPDAYRRVQERLPPGARTVRGSSGLETVGVPGRRLRARLLALEPAAVSGLAAGMVRIVEGTAPANAGEVALSPTLLRGLDRGLGDAVALEYGALRTITGVVVDPEDLELPLVLRTPAHVEHPASGFVLVELDAKRLADTTIALHDAGFGVLARADAAVDDDIAAFFVFALGSIGLFESALVISAAFAVGLRRRQVEIGLLGANGAEAGGLVRSLLLSAAGMALVGGGLGIVLGIGAAAALYPWLDGWANRMCGPFEVGAGDVIGAVVLGVLAAVLAAVLPARGAARLNVRQALSGRRPAAHRSRGWLFLGLGMVATSVLLLGVAPRGNAAIDGLAIIAGPILGILGFGACAPWLLDWLARRAAPLPLAWRLAVRDAGRFRERNGAVVTAVLAGMCMSVTVAALVESLETAIDRFPAAYRDDQLLVEGPAAEDAARAIALELPTLAVAPLAAAYTHGEPVRGEVDDESLARRGAWVAVGDARLAGALGADEGIDALERGHLLVLDAPAAGSALQLTSWIDRGTLSRPALAHVTTSQRVREPALLLHEQGLETLGLESGPPPSRTLVPWIVRLAEPVTAERLARAQAIAGRSVRTSVDAQLLRGDPFRGVYYAVLLICMLTGLLIVVIATALSAAESAADERILNTIGAAPGVLRGHLAARAGYLTLLGCLLAVPAGLIVAAALSSAVNFPLPFVVPWVGSSIVVLVFPAVVFATTWCFGLLRPARLSSV